jgi:hypothetical protein
MVQHVTGQVSELYELDFVSGVSYVFNVCLVSVGS